MIEYLGVDVDNNINKSVEEFIAENLNMDIEKVKTDIDFYNESLDCLIENTVKADSKLLCKENRPSLLAMMVYSYQQDVNLDDWLEGYAKRNNTYYVDAKRNFLHMKQDFEQFIENENRKSA